MALTSDEILERLRAWLEQRYNDRDHEVVGAADAGFDEDAEMWISTEWQEIADLAAEARLEVQWALRKLDLLAAGDTKTDPRTEQRPQAGGS